MTSCKEIKTKKYQSRSSPPFHAKDCKGDIKQGKDGSYISKPDSNGVYKWIKQKQGQNQTRKQKKGKRYEIHDNGGRPFFVCVDGKSIIVSKNMDTFEQINGKFVDIKADPKEIFTVQANEVFIGKKSPNGDYDGLPSKDGDGNSILLRIGSKYRYIGHEIYDFAPIKGDIILHYYSDIGNNDVPYPYAVGKTHIYIMLDKEAVEKTYFNMSEPIYEQYYYEHSVHMCLKGNPKTDLCADKSVYEPRIKEFKSKCQTLKTKQIMNRAF
jgi:hypothetical protein